MQRQTPCNEEAKEEKQKIIDFVIKLVDNELQRDALINNINEIDRDFVKKCFSKVIKELGDSIRLKEVIESKDEKHSEFFDRHYKGSSLSLKEKKAKNVWDSIDDFLIVLQKMRKGEWNWFRNTNCKYVDLRVDMRDGGCLIYNNEGERIEIKDLDFQYKSE